jgi:RNA polymerase sigma-70 factor (ECF subfamily)
VRLADGAGGGSEEARLLGRIAAGDEAALVALYARVGGAVYATCLRIVGDPDDAQDATAEAFWRFWTRSDRFDPRLCSATAWILTVTRRIALDARRSRTRHGAALTRFGRELDTAAGSPEERALDRHDVADVFARLAPGDRALLEAAYFEGLSGAEISTRDAVALGTVKSRLRAAMARLRIAWGRREP